MQIPRELPQFEDEHALVLVATGHEGIFYTAHSGNIEKQGAFRVENPEYSDREGHFETHGKGKLFISGSVYEPKRDKVRVEFLRTLGEELEKITSSAEVTTLYLFCPSPVMKSVKKEIPRTLRKKLVCSVEGNYSDAHPTELLNKLLAEQKLKRDSRIVGFMKREAKNILEKSRRARKIIGKK